MDVHRGKLTLSVLNDVVEFNMFGAQPLPKKEARIEEESPPSQDTQDSETIEEFLRTLEEEERSLNNSETLKKEELLAHNKSLLTRIEQLEQEKEEQMRYLVEVMKLISDLKEAYTSSTQKMQDRIFDLMKELEVRDMVDDLNTTCPGRKRASHNLNTAEGVDNHGGTFYSPTCYYCGTQGHKRPNCMRYHEFCKTRNVSPRRVVGRPRQIWVRKDTYKESSPPQVNSTPDLKTWLPEAPLTFTLLSRPPMSCSEIGSMSTSRSHLNT